MKLDASAAGGPVAAGLEPLLSIEQLSDYLGVPVKTLYDWRVAGRGPCAIHVGRQLRYFLSDVRDWLADQREADPGRGVGRASRRG